MWIAGNCFWLSSSNRIMLHSNLLESKQDKQGRSIEYAEKHLHLHHCLDSTKLWLKAAQNQTSVTPPNPGSPSSLFKAVPPGRVSIRVQKRDSVVLRRHNNKKPRRAP